MIDQLIVAVLCDDLHVHSLVFFVEINNTHVNKLFYVDEPVRFALVERLEDALFA